MSIPYRERGYSVERDTHLVHERYQDHAPTAQRTSAQGVTAITNGQPIPCPVCFPPPPPVRARRTTFADFRAAVTPEPDTATSTSPVTEPEPDAW